MKWVLLCLLLVIAHSFDTERELQSVYSENDYGRVLNAGALLLRHH